MTRTEILQIAKPILFNTDMVRAILDGRKMVTRRAVKFTEGRNPNWTGYKKDGLILYNGKNEPCNKKPPYQPGDILYVRETWCWCPCWDCGMDTEEGCCDKSANKFYNHEKREYGCYGYKASFKDNEQPFDKWRPSIHMPKEAARIFLHVTDVRAERLQDMPHDGPIKEGIHFRESPDGFTWKQQTDMKNCYNSSMGAMKDLWNSTIPKKDLDKYGWDTNPWVWVIEFERIGVDE